MLKILGDQGAADALTDNDQSFRSELSVWSAGEFALVSKMFRRLLTYGSLNATDSELFEREIPIQTKERVIQTLCSDGAGGFSLGFCFLITKPVHADGRHCIDISGMPFYVNLSDAEFLAATPTLLGPLSQKFDEASETMVQMTWSEFAASRNLTPLEANGQKIIGSLAKWFPISTGAKLTAAGYTVISKYEREAIKSAL